MHRAPSLALCIALAWTVFAVAPAHAQPSTLRIYTDDNRLKARAEARAKFKVGEKVKVVELLDSTTTKELIGLVGIVQEVDPLANGHFNYYIGSAGPVVHYMHEEELKADD